MGQYYIVINKTKREAFEPISSGVKLMEFAYMASATERALIKLLQSRWGNDEVAVVGDYYEDGGVNFYGMFRSLTEDLDKNSTLHKIIKQTTSAIKSINNSINLIKNTKEAAKTLFDEEANYFSKSRYFCNNKRKEFIDLFAYFTREFTKRLALIDIISDETIYDIMFIESPVILLLALGNGLGGGDYHVEAINSNLVGEWAFEPVTIETHKPDGYVDLTESIVFNEKERRK